jgi:hypothetical protein
LFSSGFDEQLEQQNKMEIEHNHAEELKVLESEMKASVIHDPHVTVNEAEPVSKPELAKQLTEYHCNIKSSKRQEVYVKCLMGRNLLKIQKTFRGKKAKAKFMAFVKDNLTTYNESEIYFMMKLHKLSLEFNRLMYVTMGIGKLKSKLKQVEEVMRKNPVYWTNVPIHTTN